MDAGRAADAGRQIYEFMMPSEEACEDELAKVKRELEILRQSDIFSVVEMAVQIQTERGKVVDATKARDAAVERLNDAYTSLKQKAKLVDWLHNELKHRNVKEYDLLKRIPSPAQADEAKQSKQEVARLEGVVKTLRKEIQTLKENEKNYMPPRYDDMSANGIDNGLRNTQHLLTTDFSAIHQRSSRSNTPSSEVGDNDDKIPRRVTTPKPTEPPAQVSITARNKILASIPVPVDYPDESLDPIIIPTSSTFHDLLNSTYGFQRNCLANYRVLQEYTTYWCPEREEHGYFLAPVYRCSTNPRVATAHRWTVADVMARLNKPIECFFYKDAKYYYAGRYKAFRLDDLTTKEWEALSNETTSVLVKETITARKNTSPQNVYEVSQLYSAGALKVACIGLQCVGFNMQMYRCVTSAGQQQQQAVAPASASVAGATGWKQEALPHPPPQTPGKTGVLDSSTGYNTLRDVKGIMDGIGGMSIGKK